MPSCFTKVGGTKKRKGLSHKASARAHFQQHSAVWGLLIISPEFHRLLDDPLLQAHSYTVISFPGMHGDSTSIVDSKTLQKALRKYSPTSDGRLAVTHAFTAEAQAILASLKVLYFFTSDFYWSMNLGPVSVTSEARRCCLTELAPNKSFKPTLLHGSNFVHALR